MFEADESTPFVENRGWTLPNTQVNPVSDTLSFDMASLNGLSADQAVTFVVSLSGDHDKQSQFGNSMDYLVVDGFVVIPEPNTFLLVSAGLMVGMMGVYHKYR
jgi:hypothetical protein